jgi:hypothetical protein
MRSYRRPVGSFPWRDEEKGYLSRYTIEPTIYDLDEIFQPWVRAPSCSRAGDGIIMAMTCRGELPRAKTSSYLKPPGMRSMTWIAKMSL